MDKTYDSLIAQLKPLLTLFDRHPYMQAIIVLATGLLLSLLVQRVLFRALQRAAQRSRTTLDDRILAIAGTPVLASLVLLTLAFATTLSAPPHGLQSFLMSLWKSLAVGVWTLFANRLARTVLRHMARQRSRYAVVTTKTLPLFENVAMLVFTAVGIYLLFSAWQVDMTAWLASAGIAGIAIGFAAKDTLANLISGVFILADGPYKVGDYVVLDSGERGEVTHIGIRSTRLLTRDDVEVTIPNSIMGNSKIINESGGPYTKFRIRIPIGVAYGSNVDQVRSVLLEVAAQDPQVCSDPEPRIRFRAFGGSSLDFELLCWVYEPMLRGRVIDTLLTAIYKRFQAEGIEIPYSKHDVYIKTMPKEQQ